MFLVIDNFFDVAAPGEFRGILQTSGGVNRVLEDIAAEAPPEVEINEALMQQQVQTFLAANPEVVNFLQSRNITATAGNIRALDRLTRSHRALADVLEEAERSTAEDEEDLTDALPDTSLSQLKEGASPGGVLSRILDAVRNLFSGKTKSSAESLLGVTHALNNERGFQLPLKLNGKVSNLQLYVLNEQALTADGARILLSLDTPNLGMVTSYFTINRGTIDVVVTTVSQQARDALLSETDSLREMLHEAGITVNNLQVVLDNEPALETSLPPDALQQWANDSPTVQSLSQSTLDYRA